MLNIIFLFILIKLSSCQLQQSEIDEQLSDQNSALIFKESRIALVLNNFSLQIKSCSQSLKSSNISVDLTNSLNNYDTLILQLSTIKNFKPYVNISTCGDINYKITMLDFDQKKLRDLISKIYKNTSLIYKLHADLVRNYNLNLRTLGFLSEQERKVFGIISGLNSILSEFWDYVRVLSISIGKLSYFNIILSVFKKSYCQCLNNVAWNGFNSTLEANVQVVENQLIIRQSRIQNFTSTAVGKLKTVQTSSTFLTQLQTILQNIQTISDYKKISWPNIANCNDFMNRIKFLQFKQWQYIEILSSASQNRSFVSIYRNAATVTIRNQSTTLKDALNSALNVENFFLGYISQLVYSIVKMSRMIGDFGFYGDTHCTCDFQEGPTTTTLSTTSTTTTTPSTTSTTSTTTSTTSTSSTTSTTSTTMIPTSTTEPPCGTFVSYDPVNSVTAPELNGFQGGIFYADNVTKEFVGYGNGAPCGNQNPAAGYIRTVNNPGCYIACGGSESFDNKTAKYLLNHSQLTWVPVDTTTMRNVPGTLKIGSGNGMIFFFGRILYKGFYQVGKLHAGPSLYQFYFQGPSGVVGYSSGFEMLTCSPATTTTSTTTVTTSTTIVPCGTLQAYNPTTNLNAPETLGFLSGTYYDGSPMYAGTGNYNCNGQNPAPARITTTNGIKGPGSYGTCGNPPYDFFDNTTAKFFLNSPNLKWVPASYSTIGTIPGIIPVVSALTMHVGRTKITIANGTFDQIGKIYAGTLYYFHFGLGREQIINDYEVLACQ